MTLNEAAAELQISPATLRNWVRSGLIFAEKTDSNICFSKLNIKKLREQLKSGQVAKLRKRANKNISEARHGHCELLRDARQESALENFLHHSEKNTRLKLLALYLHQLSFKKLCQLTAQSIQFKSKKLELEVAQWGLSLECDGLREQLSRAHSIDLDLSDNLLGYAYQSLCQVGAKQKAGAYYTPPAMTKKLVSSVLSGVGPVLDPCCGSGQFIAEFLSRLQFLGAEEPWEYVYGSDIDLQAVLIARANLTLASNGKADAVRQIRHQNSLLGEFLGESWPLKFKYVLTNPPWGAQFGPSEKAELRLKQPDIKSGESFSYFLLAGMKSLESGGVLGFVLPDSFLNVRRHADIRHVMMNQYSLMEIRRCEEQFSGVFTKTFTLIVKKSKPTDGHRIKINNNDISLEKKQKDLVSDSPYLISIESDFESEKILKEIDSKFDISLRDRASWALGVVTGDNSQFLRSRTEKNFEPVYAGPDVMRFQLNRPSRYIQLNSDQLQQVAPLQYYRVKEKLIYRFICRELVFAIDRSGHGTLNSANILIPALPGYSIRAVCGVLNSNVAQFYYQKKFNTFKILKKNLESFPFPQADRRLVKKIESVVERLETEFCDEEYAKLNGLVMELYSLSEKSKRRLMRIKLSDSFQKTKDRNNFSAR